jgi:hypothetical protein
MKCLLIYNSRTHNGYESEKALINKGFSVTRWGNDTHGEKGFQPLYFDDYDCVFVLTIGGNTSFTRSQYYGAVTKKCVTFLLYKTIHEGDHRVYDISSTKFEAEFTDNLFARNDSKWSNDQLKLHELIKKLKSKEPKAPRAKSKPSTPSKDASTLLAMSGMDSVMFGTGLGKASELGLSEFQIGDAFNKSENLNAGYNSRHEKHPRPDHVSPFPVEELAGHLTRIVSEEEKLKKAKMKLFLLLY